MQNAQGQVWVPQDDSLRFKLVLEHHEPPFTGHFSEHKTRQALSKTYWWPDIRQTVSDVVQKCDVCQRAQDKRKRDEGPYRPITAAYPWEIVTIDYVSGFALSARKHTACCVICDRFTRMIHLEACKDHITAKGTAQIAIKLIFARHGCPRVILSDQGPQFDSELWKELWKTLGTRVAFASTHHPQSNRLTERMNRTLLHMIRKMANNKPQQWSDLLPLFKFAYNSAHHAVTRVSPFEANNGYLPLIPVGLLTPMQETRGDHPPLQ